jgi:mannose-6-phosphate isomerase
VTINGSEKTMSAGDTLDIAIGDLHRIANIGGDDVVFIEVQSGSYFGEDDIERIEDDFGR